ncbi:hypothetical protein, partial [Hyalangium sp.]|uniref:hypothetical protein n=1 Tax=Hyalangium sp. TaxID=2028555 RepID=UPI002D7476DF
MLASPALAAGTVLQEITIDDVGPDKPLPLFEPFYLKGTAKQGVTEVHPVFVRNNYTALGFGNIVPRLGCNEVKKALELIQEDKNSPILGKPLGVIAVDELWVRPSQDSQAAAVYDSLRRLHEAYAPTPWHREGSLTQSELAQSKEFKVLVSEPGFFRPGATYCLLMFARRRDTQQDARSIRDALLTYGRKAAESCPGQAGPAAACPAEATARQEFFQTLDRLTKVLPDTAKVGITATAENALGAMPPLFTASVSLRNLLGIWRTGRFYKAWDPPLLDPVASDPLARVIAWLLVLKGDLHPAFNGTNVSFTPDGKLKVNFIGLLADWQGIRIAEKRDAKSPDQWHLLRVTPEALKLPGSELSLLDLIEFANGRIKLGGSYEPFALLAQGPLNAALTVGAEGPEGSPDPLTELRDQTERLQALTDRAWQMVQTSKG